MASGFQLLYSALDGSGTVQLWTSDGTVAGTVELSHVANDWGGLYAEGMTGYDPASGIAGAAFRGIDGQGEVPTKLTKLVAISSTPATARPVKTSPRGWDS